MEEYGKMRDRKISGICLYCLGCNRLEDFSFKGKMNCQGFVAGYEDWYERYIKEVRNDGEK